MLRSPKFLEARQLAPRHAKQVAVVIQWFNVNIIIYHCLLLITSWLKKYEPLNEYGSVSSSKENFPDLENNEHQRHKTYINSVQPELILIHRWDLILYWNFIVWNLSPQNSKVGDSIP